MIQQILFLTAVIVGGAYLGYWFRRFEMSGFELWFPIGLIVSYAISPLVGFIVAFLMMVITWALFPYGIHNVAISAATFGAVFYIGAIHFPVTTATFLRTAMLLAIAWHVISNLLYLLTGYPWIRIFKFIMLNLFLSWLLFSRFGWSLVQWLS